MAGQGGCRAAHGSAADAGGIGKGPGGDPAPILAGQRRRRTREISYRNGHGASATLSLSETSATSAPLSTVRRRTEPGAQRGALKTTGRRLRGPNGASRWVATTVSP